MGKLGVRRGNVATGVRWPVFGSTRDSVAVLSCVASTRRVCGGSHRLRVGSETSLLWPGRASAAESLLGRTSVNVVVPTVVGVKVMPRSARPFGGIGGGRAGGNGVGPRNGGGVSRRSPGPRVWTRSPGGAGPGPPPPQPPGGGTAIHGRRGWCPG